MNRGLIIQPISERAVPAVGAPVYGAGSLRFHGYGSVPSLRAEHGPVKDILALSQQPGDHFENNNDDPRHWRGGLKEEPHQR